MYSSATITTNYSQREVQEQALHHRAETHELLLQILRNQQGEIRQVANLQLGGDLVAEPIMEAGQNVRMHTHLEPLHPDNRTRSYGSCVKMNQYP